MLRVVPMVALLALWVWAFIDCLTTPEDEIRHLPKVVWVIVVLFFPLVGSIAWLVAGKDRTQARGRQVPWRSIAWLVAGKDRTQARGRQVPWPSGRTAGYPEYERPRRTLAPDDDPEFLASLKRDNRQHEDMLKQWEADLRRREEDLRREGDRPEDGDRPAS